MHAKHSVLIVANDLAICRSLSNLLTASNVDVLVAAEGCAALRLLDRQRIDAAIIDLMMPRLDGVGVARALSARPEQRRPRVVFVVCAQPEAARRLGLATVTRAFPQPIDALDLSRELERALRAA